MNFHTDFLPLSLYFFEYFHRKNPNLHKAANGTAKSQAAKHLFIIAPTAIIFDVVLH